MRTPRNLVTGIAPAALVLVLASGAAPTASAGGDQSAGNAWSVPGPSGRHARFADQHGPVLPAPQLYLIYWGTAWMPQTAPTPTAAEVTSAVRTLMASGYLTGLTQYRGTGHGALRGSALITSSDPPDGFTDHQVAEFIRAQLSAGTIPGPDPGNQTVYGVVMPTGVTPEFTGWAGEHHSYTRSGQKIHYAWFTNAGDLGSITAIISHELVEAATDPDGSGFLGINRTCHGPGWCEIADICQSTWASIDGITVHGYWSNQANACIAPSSPAPGHPSPGGQAPDNDRRCQQDSSQTATTPGFPHSAADRRPPEAKDPGHGDATKHGDRDCHRRAGADRLRDRTSGGTPARHAAVSAGHAQVGTWVTWQGDIARVKRHIVWMGGDPEKAGRPQADPSRVTDQQDLAKVKRDVMLHAGQ